MSRLFVPANTVLLLVALAASGCNRGIRVAPNAILLSEFQQGERAYASGDYTHAIETYERFLSGLDRIGVRGTPELERTLFRLGLIYILPENPNPDPARSRSYMKRLMLEFPATSFTREVSVVLDLQSRLDDIDSELATLKRDKQRQDQLIAWRRLRAQEQEILIGEQEEQIERQVGQIERQMQQIEEQTTEMEVQRNQLERLEHELREAQATLDKLKQIDLGRPPSD